ncbi:hypothetical protein ACG04R_22135 [Roseateles sp. BYS78W]|uniref:Secreted protein n=1 Tax=Pelomonas candidula TaxID=3299025 RepID=A0ABW7HI21_9BURK
MTTSITLRCIAAGVLALSGLAHAGPAARNVDPLRLQYERERAACMQGQTRQPRDVCLREAGAAYAQARHGGLAGPGDGPQQWAANALKRCQAQPPEDREMCERRVREGRVVGSVEAGGQLTTLTVRSTDIPRSPGG